MFPLPVPLVLGVVAFVAFVALATGVVVLVALVAGVVVLVPLVCAEMLGMAKARQINKAMYLFIFE